MVTFRAELPESSTGSVELPEKGSGKSSGKILDLLKKNGRITIPELSKEVGIGTRAVEKNIKKLQDSGILKRIDGRKEGYWKVFA